MEPKEILEALLRLKEESLMIDKRQLEVREEINVLRRQTGKYDGKCVIFHGKIYQFTFSSTYVVEEIEIAE